MSTSKQSRMIIRSSIFYLPININQAIFMFDKQRSKAGLHFKQVLMSRRRINYEDRQKLSVSILSLIPQRLDRPLYPTKTFENRTPLPKRSKDTNTLDPSSQRKMFVKSCHHKKSREREKNIFDQLKINNLAGTRNYRHIIFNLNVDEILERIERKALQNQILSVGSRKQLVFCRPSFKLADSCKISHMHLIAEARYAKQQKMVLVQRQKCRSSFLSRNKPKSTSLNSTMQRSLNRNRPVHKSQEIKGWQWQAPKRYMTSYEEDLQHFN